MIYSSFLVRIFEFEEIKLFDVATISFCTGRKASRVEYYRAET